jgi:pimeloyl-ACP methyl ester carboxylesterase
VDRTAHRGRLDATGRALLWLVLLSGCSMRQLIYPIPPVPVGQPPPPLQEISLWGPAGVELEAWHRSDEGLTERRPAVAFFHGNGENLETMRRAGLFDRLLALEVPLLALDYPGYGNSAGLPTEGSLKEGAALAIDWLGERYPERPLVACGWSLGAALAIHLAAEGPRELAGVVAMSPWSSLEEVAVAHFPRWLVGIGLRERYDSLAAAPEVSSPCLIVHGAADRIIPAAQARRLAEALPRQRRVVVEGAGHNDLLGQSAVWREVTAFLDELASISPG